MKSNKSNQKKYPRKRDGMIDNTIPYFLKYFVKHLEADRKRLIHRNIKVIRSKRL